MENNLTEKERELLTQIVNDKYSVGAFSGMIFNTVISEGERGLSTEQIVKKALQTRLLLTQLTQKGAETQ